MGLYMLFLAAGIVLGIADKIPGILLTRSSGFQSWSLINTVCNGCRDWVQQ